LRFSLSEFWQNRAIEVGKQRQADALAAGYVRYCNGPDNPEIYHIHGAVTEAGVASQFKMRWDWEKRTVGGIDVGGLIEVRSRPAYKIDRRELGIRPRDRELGKAHLPFVLVWVYADLSMELKGWLYGWEGMHEDDEALHRARWNANSKCWYNPPPYRSIDELKAIIAERRMVEA